VCIVIVTVVGAVTVDVMHVLSADPDKLLPVELARDSSEFANAGEIVLLPDTAIVGAADSTELTDDS
jgi:hypothetical protein